MMAGGFIGGIIGSALGNALMSIGTVDPGEAEFLGYEDEIVDLPNAVDVYNEPLVNPTGGGIRGCEARWGCGHWGAPRGTRTHWQIDITGQPGQDVVAPFSGIAERVGTGVEQGVRITGVPYGEPLQTDLIHIDPSFRGVVYVQQGERIGTLMNLNQFYPGITPHVHVELFTPGPWNFINPTPYFFLHY